MTNAITLTCFALLAIVPTTITVVAWSLSALKRRRFRR